MSTPRQEAAKEELRKALRKVLAYKPFPKDPKPVAEAKGKYRRSVKERRSEASSVSRAS